MAALRHHLSCRILLWYGSCNTHRSSCSNMDELCSCNRMERLRDETYGCSGTSQKRMIVHVKLTAFRSSIQREMWFSNVRIETAIPLRHSECPANSFDLHLQSFLTFLDPVSKNSSSFWKNKVRLWSSKMMMHRWWASFSASSISEVATKEM